MRRTGGDIDWKLLVKLPEFIEKLNCIVGDVTHDEDSDNENEADDS